MTRIPVGPNWQWVVLGGHSLGGVATVYDPDASRRRVAVYDINARFLTMRDTEADAIDVLTFAERT